MEKIVEDQIVENVRDIPGFADSEEIDFGTEPSSGQVNTEERIQGDQDAEEEAIEPTEPVDIDDMLEEMTTEPTEDTEETLDPDTNQEESTKSSEASRKDSRLVQLPLSKIKQIMKFDPNVHIITAEAIFLVTRAAELFVQTLTKESYKQTAAGKKKTIAKRDVDITIESVDTLMFLEGMMNPT